MIEGVRQLKEPSIRRQSVDPVRTLKSE